MSSFIPRTSKVPSGLKFEDKLISKYALGDKVVKVGKHMEGDKEVEDFLVRKVPIKIESFHMDKLIQENSKGADLKSILKRVQTTGDISLLNSRNVIYGDSSMLPKNTGEAYQKVIDDSRKLNNLSREEVDLVALCKGKTPEEVIAICNDYYNKKLNKGDKKVLDEVKPEVKEEKVEGN